MRQSIVRPCSRVMVEFGSKVVECAVHDALVVDKETAS